MRDFVIDASMGARGGLFCFCPVELDAETGEITNVIIGLNYLSDSVPAGGRLVAIIHEDGQEAVEAFWSENEAALLALRADTGKPVAS